MVYVLSMMAQHYMNLRLLLCMAKYLFPHSIYVEASSIATNILFFYYLFFIAHTVRSTTCMSFSVYGNSCHHTVGNNSFVEAFFKDFVSIFLIV